MSAKLFTDKLGDSLKKASSTLAKNVGNKAVQGIISKYLENTAQSYAVEPTIATKAIESINQLVDYLFTCKNISSTHVKTTFPTIINLQLSAISSSPRSAELGAKVLTGMKSKNPAVAWCFSTIEKYELGDNMRHFTEQLTQITGDTMGNATVATSLQTLTSVAVASAEQTSRTESVAFVETKEIAVHEESGLETYPCGLVKVREDMTDAEEDEFIQSLFGVADSLDPKDPATVAEAFAVLATMTSEVMKFCDMQKTKREAIMSRTEIAIKQIEMQTQLLSQYLQNSFDERKEAFDKYFQCIDAALANGDVSMLATSLNGMNALAASSPFKDLANINTVQNALMDKDTVWDI